MKPNSKVANENRIVLFYLSKYFYWLLLFLIIILVFVFYFFFVRPQLSRNDVTQYFNQKSEMEQLNFLKQQKSEVEAILNDFRQFSSQNSQGLEKLLPREKEIPNLILQLDSFAKESNLVLISFSVGGQQNSENEENVVSSFSNSNSEENLSIGELKLTLNFKTSDDIPVEELPAYVRLKNLISLIETNLRLMDITALNFANNNEEGFSLDLKTYFYQ
jgi:hypothetical protein